MNHDFLFFFLVYLTSKLGPMKQSIKLFFGVKDKKYKIKEDYYKTFPITKPNMTVN